MKEERRGSDSVRVTSPGGFPRVSPAPADDEVLILMDYVGNAQLWSKHQRFVPILNLTTAWSLGSSFSRAQLRSNVSEGVAEEVVTWW